MQTIVTPESSGSGSCVQIRDDGGLFIQSFDSYSYQRELILSRKGDGWELHAYQHPGRRHIARLSDKDGGNLVASLIHGFKTYPANYFNPHTADRARNVGFVRLQEAIFLGITNLSDYL